MGAIDRAVDGRGCRYCTFGYAGVMTDLSEIKASDSEQHDLRTIDALVHSDNEVTLGVGDQHVTLPSSLVAVLQAATRALAAGDTLAVIAEHAEVSPAEAARLLGVSRQYIDRLIDHEVLPARRLPDSTYRRLPVRAVLAHAETKQRKRAAIERLTDDALALGVDY